MGKVCAFFGHRELYNDITPQLEEAISTAVKHGYDVFWSGGNGAFDRCAAGTVYRLKKKYPHIKIVLIQAYLPKQPISEIYDQAIFPEGVEIGPPRFAINRRNQWIIRNCEGAICYVNHSYGGAYAAYRKLLRNKKVLVNLGMLTLSFPGKQ